MPKVGLTRCALLKPCQIESNHEWTAMDTNEACPAMFPTLHTCDAQSWRFSALQESRPFGKNSPRANSHLREFRGPSHRESSLSTVHLHRFGPPAYCRISPSTATQNPPA